MQAVGRPCFFRILGFQSHFISFLSNGPIVAICCHTSSYFRCFCTNPGRNGGAGFLTPVKRAMMSWDLDCSYQTSRTSAGWWSKNPIPNGWKIDPKDCQRSSYKSIFRMIMRGWGWEKNQNAVKCSKPPSKSGLEPLKRNLAAWNLCHFNPPSHSKPREETTPVRNQVQRPKSIKSVGWCTVQWCPMLRKAADDIKRQFFFQKEQGCGIPSANITRLALRPVSCPRLDSCGPSRCNNSFRRAAYDAANARCGAPGFHGLATSSPQDGTENARCGSTCGTWAVPTSHGSYGLHMFTLFTLLPNYRL